jgi:hypothetical protein
MQEELRFVFYWQRGCPACAEVEDFLEQHAEGQYLKVLLTRTHHPGISELSWKGGSTTIASTLVPGAPAIWDKQRGLMPVGDRACIDYMKKVLDLGFSIVL